MLQLWKRWGACADRKTNREVFPAPPRWRGGAGGFTLIELLVAVGLSVILLAVLTYVFRTSTAAARQANSQVSLTERLRSLNLRMRQEVAGMVSAVRSDAWPYTYAIKTACTAGNPAVQNNVLVFTAATVQDGKSVTVDVAYVFEPGKTPNFDKGRLIRLRDATGPQADLVASRLNGVPGKAYTLGDDYFIVGPEASGKLNGVLVDTITSGLSGDPDSETTVLAADVMMTNVRDVQFKDWDPPPTATDAAKQLNPRTLPAGIQMIITFGPEVGNTDLLQTETLTFPVPRGL